MNLVIIEIILFFLFLFRGVLVSQDVAVRALEAQGHSNIEIVDSAWFAVGLRGCDTGDAARFTARVINPAGKPAEIYVCSGAFFKGGTIRTR